MNMIVVQLDSNEFEDQTSIDVFYTMKLHARILGF